ncbi:S8 family serine peptidase [Paraburkholderia sp. NMBU_R16]|uniref:S8 family peptidase n=1 Tax=Paraburkholderia sp. NMBU_R16 TaxID=2698676 RepID=UPI001565771C|nr:S8 family serine peptidase [Paraburkholderia sp. NMBU_R16]NRO95774.1 S8 family serine peptidase [Paraburkholderia sp. NMBU_R16]
MKGMTRVQLGTLWKAVWSKADRRIAAARLVALLAAVVPLAVACSHVSLVPPSNVNIDPDVLRQIDDDRDRMIVVAVANPSESVPILAGTTIGGYDGGPGYAAYGSARATIDAIARDYKLEQVMAWPIVPLKAHCAVLEIRDERTRAQVIEELSHDRRVKIVQPLQSFRTVGTLSKPGADVGALADTAAAADTKTTVEHEYRANYVDFERGLREIDALAAQRISQGAGVRVAVIDTGVDASHPGLAGSIAMRRDFVEQNSATFGHDVHGTAVAGVIAANLSGGRGMVGVAPRARILALKACWQEPTSSGGHAIGQSVCNSLTLAEALAAAIEAHANVINLSLSGPPDPLLTQLVEYSLRHGIVVVGAVPPSGDMHAFPVGIAHVIAADYPGVKTAAPVVRAPGRDVLSLTPGGHYDFFSGTSFSTAFVSGVAALLLAVDPRLDSDKIYAALKSSVHGDAAHQTVDACGALSAAVGIACADTVNQPH